MASKLFVGNLDFKTTKTDLEELFGQAGSVVDVFLPTDRATGKPRGFGFVEYATEAEAQAAIDVVRTTAGVARVVSLFEILPASDIRRLDNQAFGSSR